MCDVLEGLDEETKERATQVLELFNDRDEISVSLIQRSLSWGYPLATSIINLLVDKCLIKKGERAYKYVKVMPQEIVSTCDESLDKYLNLFQKVFFVASEEDNGEVLLLNIIKNVISKNNSCCVISKDIKSIHKNLREIIVEENNKRVSNYSMEDCNMLMNNGNLISIENNDNKRVSRLDLLFPIINSGIEYCFVYDVDLHSQHELDNLTILLKELSFHQVKLFFTIKNAGSVRNDDIKELLKENIMYITKINEKEFNIFQPNNKYENFRYSINKESPNLIENFYEEVFEDGK